MAVKLWARGTVSFFFTKVALAAFVLFGMAATIWAQPSPFLRTYPVVRSGAYDFNGDGVKDLVWQRWNGETYYVPVAAGRLALWMMGGSPTPQPTQFVSLSADPTLDLSGVGDFDGDGKADLVWRNTVTGDVVIWLMDSGTVKSSVTVAAGLDKVWQILGVGDLDGDSRADLIWRDRIRGDVAAWLLDGASLKAWATLLPALDPVNWRLDGIGDLDGDGRADLIWRSSYQSGEVVAWMMDGLTVRSWGTVFKGLEWSWKLSAVADLDGDTKADLVWRSLTSGDVDEWLMDGLAVKERATLYRRLDQSWQITGAGDLDGDGRADLVWRNETSSELAEWMMNGSIIKGWSSIKPEGTVSFESTVSDQVEVSAFSILVYQWPGASFQSIAPLIRLRNKSPEVGLNVVRMAFDRVPGWNLQQRIEPGASLDLLGLFYGMWDFEIELDSKTADTLGVTISFVDETGRGGTLTARGKIGDASPNRIDPGWISR